ncbi:MAG: prolyl oligopeptidase family serine peptidase [Ginsengibacter sp.]
MSRIILTAIFAFTFTIAFSQKKPLDHSVYDGWESIGKRSISNDGKWAVYNISLQEGDDELIVQSTNTNSKLTIPRGYNATITEDNRFVIFSIKPFYKDIREARIKKKKADDQPKDSLGILELGTENIWKKENVKSFKTPDEDFGWVAYHLGKTVDTTKAPRKEGSKITDSLKNVIDSLQTIIEANANTGKKRKRNRDAEDAFSFTEISQMNFAFAPDLESSGKTSGTSLILRNLLTQEEIFFPDVSNYYFNKKGGKLLLEKANNPKDSLSKILVLLFDLKSKSMDTLSRGGNNFKQFNISDDGAQVAFLAERDAKPKDLQKFFKLWYYKAGMDSATLLVQNNTPGIEKNTTVSENGRLEFSKSGKRLLFGTAPIEAPKDTTLIEMDQVKLDVWHYKDDYVQPIQLARLRRDQTRNFLAAYNFDQNKVIQLASEEIPSVYTTNEGDGDFFIGVTDVGRRTESQWTGNTLKDIYRINARNGSKQLIKNDLEGVASPSYISPTGKYIVWYDYTTKNYFVFDGSNTQSLTGKIKVKLFSEDHDQPSNPPPYGVMGWQNEDESLLIYDRYDIWKADPTGKMAPQNLTKGIGRKNDVTYRYLRTDNEEKFIDSKNTNLISIFNNKTKKAGIAYLTNNTLNTDVPAELKDQPYYIGSPIKAKNAFAFIYTKENYLESPDLFVYNTNQTERKLSAINPQQNNYNWGTAELYHYKTLSGKPSTGILYKPENFDSTKKYPMILYFYEKLSDGLYRYQPPAPTPSRLNISFFVSRGYIVFAPDIEYTIGYPAKSAYDYIVSAAKDLSKKKWIDSKNIGIQGQSWGGIQVDQLITMTDMFKAAWSGAPVSNMTSAYGGIRWQTGMNRQFQYEKTQSRIGATLWEKPELYIENSPLFHLPKVKTPMVIMANDADGAVPWYQGIELFTGLVRLGKPVWMLNYNDEAHNLVERKNRKDIQIRQQQFFDWLLKGDKPALWITEGVPAINKGKDWGLELVE